MMIKSKSEILKNLTLSEIRDWAGATITGRGQTYQLEDRVRELAMTPDGGLVAWVRGTERYATEVDILNGKLISGCTCPYARTCKHAVAVLLEYQAQVSNKLEVPVTDESDRRQALLQQEPEDSSDEDEDWEDDEEEEEEEEHEHRQSLYPPIKVRNIRPVDALRSFLQKQDKPQLIDIIEDLAARNPDVRQALQDRFHLAEGKITALVNATRREIDEISAEPAWSGRWGKEGSIPDYSGVCSRLEMLLSKGYADEVVSLGQILLEAGTRQVEESDSEGDLEEEITGCMDVVFAALSQSSLPPVEQLLLAIDMELSDEYDLCAGSDAFWGQPRRTEDWSRLADKLIERLHNSESDMDSDDYADKYQRERLLDWTNMALQNSGRRDEIIPLSQREAEKTGAYPLLVGKLIDAGRRKEAEDWIKKGVIATQKDSPGIASRLRDTLREMREEDGNWLAVAAFRADDFFNQPTHSNYTELRKTTEMAGLWPAVRAAALRFLETGELPDRKANSQGTVPAWPLPEPDLYRPLKAEDREFPLAGTLTDIAIAEKQPDEILRWYEYANAHKKRWAMFNDSKIADALAGKYPDRAVAIWKRLAETCIAQTQTRAYEEAAGYLINIRNTLRQMEREDEWKSYLYSLRQANLRKRRLLEILDTLAGK